ncbi:hypothetical protein D0869_11583 [Hortaea werneckii]|uniref:Uncharacterized protein n=2 Tax=Hortaea werneckii TaxID=91943 RepID=A0A3M6WA97_HORWE|nr:hypothetical protein D0869_11583 [Hortaea werneckii]RMX96216.1 hypothetical protein D0868_11304 [Hortaea werneckii]RMY05998.1 hypothetical protein D0867_09848 [Hortaea werneckii]
MPSLLNPNLSQTSTDPQRPSPHQQPRLSSEHIDLWEHAALLYHHFEWHSAIDTFQHLALTIPAEAKEARTLCLLNAAIIQARLGDYALAAQTLEAAARTDGSFILTPYLLGIMEWELGNLIKAEACLEILLLALRRHAGEGIVDFSRHGLDFRLQGEVVREELRRLRGVNPFSEEAAAAAAAQSQIVGFAGFSANCIFEAPVREGGRSKEEEEDLTVKRRREEEEHFIPVGGGKAAINRQPDSLVVESSSSPKPTTTKNPRETFQDLKAFLRGHKPMPTPNRPNTRTSAAPPDPLRPRPRPPQPAQPLPSPAATPEATYHSTWRRRPTTPYIPRDARGEHHSVGELARFIRRYRNQAAPMSPRDPRGVGESTGELARFIRSAGGGEEGRLRMPFLEGGEGRGGLGGGEVESLLDLYLYRGDGIGLGGGGGGRGGGGGGEGGEKCISRRYSDPIPAHTATTVVTGRMERQIPSHPNASTTSHFPPSSSSSKPLPSAETVTLLLPEVYEGTSQTPTVETSTLTPLSLQLLDSPNHHRHPIAEEDNPLARFHTAGSETSSLFRHSMITVERAEIARGEALRRLEGRARGEGKALRIRVGGRGGRENDKTDDGGRGENSSGGGGSGGAPTITQIFYYDNDATVDHDTVDTMVANNSSNKMSDGKVIPATTTTTTMMTKTGRGKLLLPSSSHSKPLPPGPPRGKAGRFEVFLADGFPDRRKDDDDDDGGGGRGGRGEGGEKEEGKKEGNAVRVPSSKIFEYMSRG